ncbi:MAG TPA: PAS domain S-box protein, partial [Chroococcales cyanobacterium]
ALMQKNAVREIDRGLQIQTMVSHLTAVSNLWSNLATRAFRAIVHGGDSKSLVLSKYSDQFACEFAEIKRLLSSADDREEIGVLETDTTNAIAMLTKLKTAIESYNDSAKREYMTEIGFVADGSLTRSNKLIDRFLVEQQQNDRAQASAENSWWVALVLGLVLNFGLVVACAYMFIKEVAFKYAVITENSVRLAEGMALLAPLPGADEISVLDREFHKMADTIVAAHIKERAVIENALDLICSLSAEGLFVDLNSAAQIVLGYTERELLGKPYSHIVEDNDKERVLRTLHAIAAGEVVHSFEHAAVRKDGGSIAVQVSAQWSQLNNTLFCVIHDVTEYHRIEKVKRQLTDDVTLSLRSPLMRTRETLHSLGSVGDDDMAVLLVQQANQEIRPINKFISDLLELEKIDAAMLHLTLNKLRLHELLAEAVDELRSIARGKAVDFNLVPNELIIEGDEGRLLQAFTIVLKELIRKAQNGTLIEIGSSARDLVQIDFTYTGQAFTGEEQENLCGGVGQNLTAPVQTSVEKAYLSLIICRTLIEAHQGAIAMASTVSTLPQQNTVSIKFPVSQ